MSRSSSLLNRILREAGALPSRTARARYLSVVRTPAPTQPRCTTPCLYQRNGRCQFCGQLAPGRRGGRSRGVAHVPRVRMCADEKTVQRDCIALYVAIGCRYSAKGETDIYVLGTRRPRALPGIGHKTFQTPGIADLFVFLPLNRGGAQAPLCVWHEVKAEDGAPSPAQLRFQAQCKARFIAHVMGGVDALQAFLTKHGFLKGPK